MHYSVRNVFVVLVFSPFIFKIEEAALYRPKRVLSYPAEKLANLSVYPYVVSIWTLNDDIFTINGALLSLDWVVTAYSAILRLENYTKDSQYYASPGPRDNTTQVAVKSIYNYTATLDFKDTINDLSLVKLAVPFEGGPTVKPVKLPPNKECVYQTAYVHAVGSGSQRYENQYYFTNVDKNDKVTYDVGFGGSIRVVEFQFSAFKNTLYGYIDTSMMVHKIMTPAICTNDSGQPLITTSYGSVEGILGGIIAFSSACLKINEVTLIMHYMTWINNITGLKVPFQSTPEDVNKTSTTTGSPDAGGKKQESGGGRSGVSKHGFTISSTRDDALEMGMNKVSKIKFSKFILVLCICISCIPGFWKKE